MGLLVLATTGLRQMESAMGHVMIWGVLSAMPTQPSASNATLPLSSVVPDASAGVGDFTTWIQGPVRTAMLLVYTVQGLHTTNVTLVTALMISATSTPP